MELEMLRHYNEKEARDKLKCGTECVRCDWMIYKLNNKNGAAEEDLEVFDTFPLESKLALAAKKNLQVESCVRIYCPRSCEFIPASFERLGNNLSFSTNDYINGCVA